MVGSVLHASVDIAGLAAGRGRAGLGAAWRGSVWQGWVWREETWLGCAGSGLARRGWVRPGAARIGLVGHGQDRPGAARLGLVWHGKGSTNASKQAGWLVQCQPVRLAARLVLRKARYGEAWRGRAWHGGARQGRARTGAARHGGARQGAGNRRTGWLYASPFCFYRASGATGSGSSTMATNCGYNAAILPISVALSCRTAAMICASVTPGSTGSPTDGVTTHQSSIQSSVPGAKAYQRPAPFVFVSSGVGVHQ